MKTSNKQAFFEQKIKEAAPGPQPKKTWKTTGNSGGGHTGHDGKYRPGVKMPRPTEPPPPPKSLSDLP